MALLTRRELADRLRVSLSTVARGIEAGSIRAVRMGGQLRIPGDEANRLEAEGFSLSGLKKGA